MKGLGLYVQSSPKIWRIVELSSWILVASRGFFRGSMSLLIILVKFRPEYQENRGLVDGRGCLC